MPGIVEWPTVVRVGVGVFGQFFDNECQRRHFAEYICGLIIAHRKTVTGINREFAETTDQSCLNRFLTEAPWDAEVRRGDKRQWCFTVTLKIPHVRHKVRIVILWDHRRDEKPCKVLVTNRTTWEVNRILGVSNDLSDSHEALFSQIGR